MLVGLFFSLLAGSLVGLQNIFNSKVNERAGSWATTTLVLGLGFLASLLMGLIFEGGELFHLHGMKPWYWVSGVIGIGVVTCIVQGINRLGPTVGVSVALISQLAFALWWDSMGFMGLDKVPFSFKKLLGVLVIVAGIMVFKFGGQQESQKKSEIVRNRLIGRN